MDPPSAPIHFVPESAFSLFVPEGVSPFVQEERLDTTRMARAVKNAARFIFIHVVCAKIVIINNYRW